MPLKAIQTFILLFSNNVTSITILTSLNHNQWVHLTSTLHKLLDMENTIRLVGTWSAWLACSATVAYVAVQLMQVAGLLHFPLDEVLIYGTSLGIVLPFVLSMLALYHLTPRSKKFWSHGALIFTLFYAVFVIANYVVQLATVIPAKVRGEGFAVRVLDQTPHSMFWNFDALGYIFMGAAMLMAIPAFSKTGFGKRVRIAFLVHAGVTPLIAFVYFYPYYSNQLLVLGYPWGVTAPLAMGMLAGWFTRNPNADAGMIEIPGLPKKEKMSNATILRH